MRNVTTLVRFTLPRAQSQELHELRKYLKMCQFNPCMLVVLQISSSVKGAS